MSAAEAILSALERNWDMIDAALEGLDDATLSRRPTDQCNSIAWILWHTSRVVDTFIYTRLQSKPSLWVVDGWYQKFGMSDDAEDRGVGWSAEQVAAFAAPPRHVMLEYFEAVKASAREYLSSLTGADLEKRMVIPPVTEPRTVANAVGQMLWDNVAHGGQIAYVRGFYRGMGWHR